MQPKTAALHLDMEFDAPGPTLLLAVLVTLAVLFIQRAKWVRKLREGMQAADPAQLERMPSFGRMILRFWVHDAKGFGWRKVPRTPAENVESRDEAA